MANVQVVLEGIDNLSGVVNAISATFSGNFTAALDLAMKALGGVSDMFTGFLKSAIEGEDATTAFDFALQKQGNSAVITAAHGQALAESLKNLVGGQNDTVLSAEGVLLKFKEINSEAFPGALKLSADLAASMGTDMSSAAQTLGKALENPATGMRLIKTVGGEVDPEFQKIITRMVAMGDTADADSAIMNKLNDVIGGKAASAASTLSGQWQVMLGNLSDLGQKIGDDFLPVLHTLFDTVMQPAIKIVEEWGNKVAQAFSVFQGGDLIGGLTNLYTNLLIAVPVLQRVDTAFREVWDFVQKNWPILQATGRVVFQDLQQIGGLFVGFIKDSLIPAFEQIRGTVDIHLPGAQETFNNTMSAITKAMAGVVNFMRDSVIPTLTNVVNWVVEHWPQIKETAEGVWHAVGVAVDAARAVLSISLNAMQSAGAIFNDIMTGNWRDIGTQLQKIWNDNWATMKIILKGALDTTLTMIQALDWRGTGSAIMKQFVRGIRDEAENVLDAIFGTPMAAYTALSRQFGVQNNGSIYQNYSSGYTSSLASAW